MTSYIPAALEGTPYSLPPSAALALGEMRGRLTRARHDLTAAVEHAQSAGLIAEIRRSHDYWTVYESNSIEFEGPDLAGTVRAIQSHQGQDVLRDLNVHLLPEVMKRDREAYAAIGLEAARVIAHRYVGTGQRGVSQADLRDLHSVLMAGEWHAGGYRQFPAEIQAATHEPFPTYKIHPAMCELADWSRVEVDPEEAILRASVAHAWFTHIHPFQDGNGRVARLLANVLLGQSGLPPAIVKARSQRNRYIAALAHSDEAGDIMPLTGLFLDTLERYVSELQNPRTFQKMFNDLVAGRGDSYYDWYAECFLGFLRSLRTELELYGLHVHSVDHLSRDVFEDTRRSDGARNNGRKNVTAAIVTNAYGREVSIYMHTPSTQAQRLFSREELVPSISLAVPNELYELRLHRRLTAGELDGLSGFWVQPDRTPQVYCVVNGQPERLTVSQGASLVSDHLRAAFARGFAAPDTRWTPHLARVDGG